MLFYIVPNGFTIGSWDSASYLKKESGDEVGPIVGFWLFIVGV